MLGTRDIEAIPARPGKTDLRTEFVHQRIEEAISYLDEHADQLDSTQRWYAYNAVTDLRRALTRARCAFGH